MELLLPILHQPDLSWAEKVAYLAWRFREAGGRVEADFEVRHIFEPGRYIREFELPGDFLFIGRVHRRGHLVELLRGRAVLITGAGNSLHSAYEIMETPPGFQTVARTLTPVVARSIHVNPRELRDVEELEDEFFEPAELTLVKGQGIQERLQRWLAQ